MRFRHGHHARVPEIQAKRMTPEVRRRLSEQKRGERNPAWIGDAAGYRRAHYRLENARGRADQYACVLCGGAAQEWGVDHGHESLRTEEMDSVHKGRRYSLDLDAYHPLCRSCHRKADAHGGFRF